MVPIRVHQIRDQGKSSLSSDRWRPDVSIGENSLTASSLQFRSSSVKTLRQQQLMWQTGTSAWQPWLQVAVHSVWASSVGHSESQLLIEVLSRLLHLKIAHGGLISQSRVEEG